MLDRKSSQPLYAQFEEIVRHKIGSGEWPIDSAIPSENELSAIYGISRMTVRSVLTNIVAEGLLYRVQGKGTFVSEPKILSRPLSQMGIRAQLEHMGYETSTELLGFQEIHAPGWTAEKLNIYPASPIFVVTRLRYIKDVPFSIHRSYIPKAICPDLDKQDLERMQLCDIQEQIYHQEIVRRVETLESVISTSEESELLKIRKNSPLLLFENLVYTKDDRPIECSKVLFRAEKIKLRMEYIK